MDGATPSSGWTLVSLGVLAVAGGAWNSVPEVVAFGATLIAVPLAILVLLRVSANGVELRQTGPESSFEGDDVEVHIVLRNRSALPLFHPRFEETFRPEHDARKVVVFPDRIDPGERYDRSYRGRCKGARGVYGFGPSVLILSDPFGWWSLKRWMAADWRLRVYPRLTPTRLSERHGSLASLVDRATSNAVRGDSSEFFAVREYCLGDPRRRIHWRLTAHRGYPVVREFAAHVAGDFAIHLDVCSSAGMGRGPRSNFENSVRFVAAVAASACRNQRSWSLACGDSPDLFVPPGAGHRQLTASLDALVTVVPNGTDHYPESVLAGTVDVTPGSVIVLCVHPYLFDDPRLVDCVSRLRAQGLAVAARIFDARWPHSETRFAEECAARLTRAGAACDIHVDQRLRTTETARAAS